MHAKTKTKQDKTKKTTKKKQENEYIPLRLIITENPT